MRVRTTVAVLTVLLAALAAPVSAPAQLQKIKITVPAAVTFASLVSR